MSGSDASVAVGGMKSLGQGGRAVVDRGLAWAKRKPLVPLLVGGALVVAILAALMLWAGGPDYRVLYSNLSDSDGGKIISALEQQGIPYKFAQGGHALMVPSDKVYNLRLKLAEQGLPQAGNVGFEIMDKQPFGISQFAEQVNYQRGLQGELANSIEALDPVQSARVHLALPKDSLFVRERQPAKATVVLTLRPGRALGEGQVNAIVHMVSSSVRDLAADNVTVVDQNGHLLTRNGADADLDGTQLDYVREVERRYQQRIESILTPILGSGNVHAQVTAQVDFNRSEETSEHYGPNQGNSPAAVRSHQVNFTRADDGSSAGGIPGALTNTPPGSAASPINNPPSSAATSGNGKPGTTASSDADPQRGDLHRESTTNYEVDRNITHTQRSLGAVQRLSVAVVVNYRDEKQKDGSMKAVALDPNMMKQIQDLTREAMGFSQQRGDTLAVVNSEFSASANASDQEPWWKQFDWFSVLGTLGRYLLVLIAAIVLYRMVLKPLRQRYLAIAPVAPAGKFAGKASAEAEAAATPRPPRKASTYEHSLQDLKDVAKTDPAMVATIVRNWVKRDGQ
ncbi:MAG: flagellar basal-body MS-ring/collar protein FliF [Rhodanobacteraceae bacterium]